MYDDNKIFDELDELCDYCISDELTLSTLQVKVKSFVIKFPLYEIRYQNFPLLHIACLSKSVTLDIVEYMLAAFPRVVKTESEDDSNYDVDGDSVDTYKKFPLHCACYNQYCPSSIVSLLIERYPNALEHFAPCEYLFIVGGKDDLIVEGLPLHYYVARETNVDIDIVKMLFEAYPQAMLAANDDDEMYFTPIHAIVSSTNEDINNLLPIIKFFIEVEPSCMRTVDEYERTPLVVASCNTNITLDTVQLLVNAWPESISIPERNGYLPIHELCCNEKLGEAASIDILQFMLDIDPTLVRETGDDDYLPIHHAINAGTKSFEFCKILIDAFPESLEASTSDGMLPIHLAVFHPNDQADKVDTIQYILDLCPECMDSIDGRGSTPMHHAAQGKRADIVELLLDHDPGAAHRPSGSLSCNLPLHLACDYNSAQLPEVVQVLFDACPQAINIHNWRGATPLDLAWKEAAKRQGDPNESVLVNFLLTQQAYARQAQDIELKTTIDKDDWLPLHCALKDKAPLGSIKLLLGALRSIGHTDSPPLNTACEFSSVKVVRYLIEADNILDEDLASMHLVHSACRGANLEVIKYFLDDHTSLVASAEVNEKGELPIQLLCGAGKNKVDNESIEYIEIIWRMLLANPEAVVGV